MLEIQNLTVEVSGKRILHDLNLRIGDGEVHVLFGANGSGKTTLFLTILGFPSYDVVEGKIYFKGVDITEMDTAERVKLGMGVSFQHPPEIRGVKLGDLVGRLLERRGEGDAKSLAERLKLSEEFLSRDLNLGFSGGEVKRSEILQLLAQNPDFFMFDEPDSGVDVENVELIGKITNEMLERDKRPSERKKSGLIISHIGYILNYIKADRAHVMLGGRIACSGMTEEIYNHILTEGFEGCVARCGGT
ncbi:putative branched-chain amino acid transport ATP-binding protein LivG [Candidatus Methanoperedenaceae archaeon GB50]|nr:putative branched-chain amino acid transport ATP-binding protein LivG [Candidatus Methanoperedenaceae archaeon GB50]CAD7772837.1 MAG: putative branched-chain amino acid transport ATP-binding protein LivG [Candidatus Methanoperedenaceae archaeon GB50]